MILIHRGKGAAVVLVGGIISALGMNVLTNALFDNEYYTAHTWPKVGSLWLAALIYAAAGVYLRRHPTKVRDKDWVEGESADHFFFVPVVYWAPIFLALGVLFAVFSN